MHDTLGRNVEPFLCQMLFVIFDIPLRRDTRVHDPKTRYKEVLVNSGKGSITQEQPNQN